MQFSSVLSESVHEGCKNFKCESCGKSLTQGYIKIINEGHKDFKCDSCSKIFLMLVI